VYFIYARGTGEQGTMGRSVGPLMTSDLKQKFGDGNVSSVGVEYPADWDGAISGAVNPKGAKGSIATAAMANQALSDCPRSSIVLCGYSQGAEQVHGALMNLGKMGADIAVRLLFGSWDLADWLLGCCHVWGSAESEA
jgi:cutinase